MQQYRAVIKTFPMLEKSLAMTDATTSLSQSLVIPDVFHAHAYPLSLVTQLTDFLPS